MKAGGDACRGLPSCQAIVKTPPSRGSKYCNSPFFILPDALVVKLSVFGSELTDVEDTFGDNFSSSNAVEDMLAGLGLFGLVDA